MTSIIATSNSAQLPLEFQLFEEEGNHSYIPSWMEELSNPVHENEYINEIPRWIEQFYQKIRIIKSMIYKFIRLQKYNTLLHVFNNFTKNYTLRFLTHNSKFLYTPIAMEYKKSGACSKKDWNEQLERSKSNLQCMWDDSATNKSKVGDVFGAVHNNNKVEMFMITSIHSKESRLDKWASNVGQGNKQVIYLSKKIYTIQWNDFINISGYSPNWKCQGTRNANKNLSYNIVSYLLDNL